MATPPWPQFFKAPWKEAPAIRPDQTQYTNTHTHTHTLTDTQELSRHRVPCGVARAQGLLHLARPEPAARMLRTMLGRLVGRHHGPHCLDDLMSDGTCHMGHHTSTRYFTCVPADAAGHGMRGDVLPRPGTGGAVPRAGSSSTSDSVISGAGVTGCLPYRGRVPRPDREKPGATTSSTGQRCTYPVVLRTALWICLGMTCFLGTRSQRHCVLVGVPLSR